MSWWIYQTWRIIPAFLRCQTDTHNLFIWSNYIFQHVILGRMQPISIYIHIPFCTHRCGYCDFNTYAGLEALIPMYAQAVCHEILMASSYIDDQLPVGTIYFGGGTPSLLPIQNFEMILSNINNHFQFMESIEISIEANPGTVSKEFLKHIYSLGVNRISLGMQSANQNELILLERQHSYKDVLNAVEWTRAAGIRNLNLDLIFGLPFQSLDGWMETLELALSLIPEHLSLYALTIEDDTPIQRKVKAGIFPEPDQDDLADMYESASERLADARYIQYEISNWARKDKNGEFYQCMHNMQYWRNLPYLGLGAGAHGSINHKRTSNVLEPAEYINRLNRRIIDTPLKDNFPKTPATDQIIPIDVDTEIGETMMLGLRLVTEGVSNKVFQQRFGISLQERFGIQITRLMSIGLLEWGGEEFEILRLTKRGRLLGNQVFTEFI
jgi:oxygen-independent coproporphyrinogen-3 oxidase